MTIEAVTGSILLALALGKLVALFWLSTRREWEHKWTVRLYAFSTFLGLAMFDVMRMVFGVMLVVAEKRDNNAFRNISTEVFHLPSIRTSE